MSPNRRIFANASVCVCVVCVCVGGRCALAKSLQKYFVPDRGTVVDLLLVSVEKEVVGGEVQGVAMLFERRMAREGETFSRVVC